MPIYKVKLDISCSKEYEIEAKDEDRAGEQAESRACDDIDADNIFITGNEIELSDNQYTDQQELLDRERESEK